MKDILEDLREFKTLAVGALALITAFTAILIGVFGTDPLLTTSVAIMVVLLVFFISWLIVRSEKRSEHKLSQHIDTAAGWLKGFQEDISYLKDMALENQHSVTRMEMNHYIHNEPNNHDTILAYAEKYFIELGGNWKQTDTFLAWMESEKEAGRPVHIPPSLLQDVQSKHIAEQKK